MLAGAEKLGRAVRRGLAGAFLGLLGAGLLAACAGGRAPTPLPFAIEAFFEGSSVSAGTVTTLLVSTQAFTAAFAGRREGNRIRLDERFTFPDGERLQRWDLRREGERYRGTVSTELGGGAMSPPVPVDGWLTPGGAVLAYRGYAPGGSDRLLGFRHTMTAKADGTVENRVRVSAIGLPVASSRVTFAKTPQALRRHADGL